MSRIGTCKKCHCVSYDWQPPHECTEFFITTDDEENVSFWVENPELLLRADGRRTPSFEDAAKVWARNYNEDGDYHLMDETMNISITRGDTTKHYTVGAVPDIYYVIKEISGGLNCE